MQRTPRQRDAAVDRGRRLQRLREDAGLEQQEAAQVLGIHRVTLSRIETGAVKKLDAALAERMRALYKLPDIGAVLDDSSSDSVSHEAVGGSDYAPNPANAQGVPEAAYRAALSFLERLEAKGIPPERLESFERLMLNDRWAGWRRDRNESPSEEEWVRRVEEIWQVIRESLASQGVYV